MKLAVLPAAAAFAGLLSGCVYAGGFYETFETRPAPLAAAMPVAAEPPPSATEVRYARDTARSVFRRRPAERTPDFVAESAGDYALCLRSGSDYALLVFERRVFDDAISQVADDARVLRSKGDTAVCRQAGRRWVAV